MIWSLVLIAFIITSLWFYRFFVKREAASDALAEKERMEKLMNEGIKVVVDLNACEIRAGSFMLEQADPINDVDAMDALVGVNRPEETQKIDQTVLIYNHTLENGDTIRFIGPTLKEKKTVQLLCAMHGTTAVYYDRNNPQAYYFDLRFLD